MGKRKPAATDIEDLAGQLWLPFNWEKTLENIRQMRTVRDAPVDIMGCDQLADKLEHPHTFRLQILISLMLSSQTKDEVTAAAMSRLIAHGCDLDSLRRIDEIKLQKLIYPVGFFKTKAKHIKKTCDILAEQYSGDIPESVEQLMTLPGVGPKMAHLTMRCARGVTSGIGVDTHVHRIANRLGWVRKPPTKTPEETRIELERWLPRDYWDEINHLLVGFGQQVCLPLRPKCEACVNAPICPSAGKSETKPTKTKRAL